MFQALIVLRFQVAKDNKKNNYDNVSEERKKREGAIILEN